MFPLLERAARTERKELTRQRMLHVTLKLIASRSLASISLPEVAREAGIVPAAFYRHFDSMDDLGVELVDDAMRALRELMRDARRGVASNVDVIRGIVETLARQVRAYQDRFRFLSRERFGGVRGVRGAIDTESRLFTSELTVDLARLTIGADWSSEDLEMTAALMVAAMLAAVRDLLEVDRRRAVDQESVILDRAERQLRLIALGMSEWRSKQ